jgi:glycosyltransferase involved in cell wall biosynthesis
MPKILLAIDKWAGGNPELGPSNTVHVLEQNLAATAADFETVYFDEMFHADPVHFNATFLEFVKRSKPEVLVFAPLIEMTQIRLNPRIEILFFICKFMKIKLIVVGWDFANDQVVALMVPYAQLADVVVSCDGVSNVMKQLVAGRPVLELWGPISPTTFRDLDLPRDIPVAFFGSRSGYADRVAGLTYLRDNGVPVVVGGGHLESRLSTEDYVARLNRTKVHLSFPKSCNGPLQLKGKIFEAALCGALTVETESAVTARFFTPSQDYVAVKDFEAMRQAILYCLDHEDERRRLVDNCRRTISAKFTAKHFWSQVFEAAAVAVTL